MLFKKPSDLNLKDITQDLPVNERFNQLEEDEYLDDLLLETDVDNVKRFALFCRESGGFTIG